MTEDFPTYLHIAEHPFYIGLIEAGTPTCVPASLPFSMGVHPRYAIPRVKVTEEIRDALDRAYSAGSMCSTPLGESRLATVRMDEIIEKILALFGGDIAGKTFLEIGCGNGELLNQLKLRGALVTGLEIGPQAEIVEQRYGIKVVRSYLDDQTFDTKFDCIYSYGCLEHIDDLAGFFAASRACLQEGGLYLHSVPNAALSFEKVQLDHLLHEHVNYFTPANGLALLAAQCFGAGGFALSKPGNELMLWGYLNATAQLRWPEERVAPESIALKEYAEKIGQNIDRKFKALQGIIGAGKSLGFYAGGYEYGYRLNHAGIRYFDGDTYKHGKRWLVGMPAIEAPASLLEEPLDCLVVCKPHYFAEISRSLIGLGVNPDSIVSIDALGN